MNVHTLQREQWLPVSVEEAWEFFATPRNLALITPPEFGLKTEALPSEKMYEGEIITYKVKILPGIWMSWVTEIKSMTEHVAFVDEQRAGPYRFWHHQHHFQEKDGGTLMTDLVHYSLGCWPFDIIPHAFFVKKKLKRVFDYRYDIIEKHFAKSK